MHFPKTAIFLSAALALGGCAADSGPKENSGTVLGAVSGALIGSAIGGGAGGRGRAAVSVAAIGGVIGHRTRGSVEGRDRQYAYEAEMTALDRGAPGAPVDWRNPETGRYGNIVPGPAYTKRGTRCRAFSHTVYINGQPTVERGTACRNPDGTWAAVG